MTARALARAVLAATCLAAPLADAAACCLSSSAFGAGRLASWEKFAVQLSTSTSPVVGRWDEGATWRGNTPGYLENEWRAQLIALGTLTSRLQANGRLPVVLTQKAAGELAEVGGGLGDAQLGLRFEPIFQGEYGNVPEVALHAGATVPTGRAPSGARSVLGSDVTGRGAWVLTGAFTTELARDTWFVQLGGGLAWALPMTTSTETGSATQQYGLGVQGTLAGGLEVRKNLVLSLVTRVAWEGPLRIDGKVVPDSASYDLGVGPALAWKLNTHWTVQAAGDFGVYVNGLGTNRQGRATVNVGVRYAYF